MSNVITELRDVAAQIEELRLEHGLTKPALINEYPLLGDKQGGAYSAALSGVMNKRNPVRLLENYTAALRQIQHRPAGVVDPLYIDLPHVTEFLEHVDQLSHHRGIKRLIVVRGKSGEGKSSLLRMVEKHRPSEVVRITASGTWRSFHYALGEMLMALGVPQTTVVHEGTDGLTLGLDRLIGCAARAAALRDRLIARRGIVCLDELQGVSGDFLTWMKDTINAAAEQGAALCFVVAGQDAMWKQLARSAPEEMRQLKANRLYLEYEMPPVDTEEVRTFLTRRLGTLDAAALRAVPDVLRIAIASGGGRALLRNTCDMLAAAGPVDASALSNAAAAAFKDMRGHDYKPQSGDLKL